MGFRSLAACVTSLQREGEAVVVDHPVDPHLEIAEIQRRLFRAGGPALLFRRPRGSSFPVLINLYGTRRRIERLFADTLERVGRLVELT
ncbi:MAG TPA: 3-octaprenyl-4-hydroxybenzoate carboxy-lyase, partial [Planctomycetaceae bacterium]|nr:3-octaprenyl-4-hydroxybenzoate carboxy-lyase [Planctomycetaceae bacterium]